jgi:hypothetical protein
MTTTSYSDAMRSVLDRLQGVGYEFGPSHVNHAPMAAEAMAWLGYTDEVSDWVQTNIERRRYNDPPEPRWGLSESDPAGWAAALGDFSRVSDWSTMFRCQLETEPWTDVLSQWWPRLLPGMSGAIMHGVIRTAHAVRALAYISGDATLQRGELAQALGYWAARYSGGPDKDEGQKRAGTKSPSADIEAESAVALQALDNLVAESAGAYASVAQSFPVPLIHAITGPAAVRLLCDHLPADHHRASYEAARGCSSNIRSQFEHGEHTEQLAIAGPGDVVAAAIDLGDEHAIKLAEVAVRYYKLSADERYLAASMSATAQITRFPS